ncbi:superoxide dismutase [Cu-Zn]-like isoform X1 [Carcharodon carcharias]|uniref:superoxide dismutase [Cu-Zn]-like isoform X1 n=1 Tax=Carcharodon carcharias TaxID=13397 RepID=UPI001B7DDDE9|nr:superoxide dismutase [Cu-Zn]-like isoform X1 [Carcharodon carcharias]
MIATGTCVMRGDEAEEDSENSVRGMVTFEWDETEEVLVKGTVKGLKPGKHGLYVCAFGNVTNGYTSSGAHYNPCDKKHGGPEDTDRHVGDLGNIEADDDGVANFEMHNRLLRLAGNYSIIGRTLVDLHTNSKCQERCMRTNLQRTLFLLRLHHHRTYNHIPVQTLALPWV